jgi:WD40 repeat protein
VSSPGLSARIIVNERMPGRVSLIDLQGRKDSIFIGGNGFLKLFREQNGACLVNWVTTVGSSQNSVLSVTTWRDTVIFGSEDGFIRCYDKQWAAVVEEWPAHESPVVHLNVLEIATTSLILSIAQGGDVCVWSIPFLEEKCRSNITDCRIKYSHLRNGNGELFVTLIATSGDSFVWNISTNVMQSGDCVDLRSGSADELTMDVKERSVSIRTRGRASDFVELGVNGAVLSCAECCGCRVALAAGDRLLIWMIEVIREPNDREIAARAMNEMESVGHRAGSEADPT